MEIHSLNEIDPKIDGIADSRLAWRQMTSEQLLDLGMNQVVYLKAGVCVTARCSSCSSAPMDCP